MLSLLAWAYIRQCATHHQSYDSLPERHSSLSGPLQHQQQHDDLDERGSHFGTHHDATVQETRNYQHRHNDAATAGRRVNLTSFRDIPLSARLGVKRTAVDLGGVGVVNLNHCCVTTNGSRPSIMRFGDNGSNLLITEPSVIVEVSSRGGTSGGQVILVDRVAATGASETNINDSVVGVVGHPSGAGGAEDAFSMNITPALSQVSRRCSDSGVDYARCVWCSLFN